jgi:hypothetical protein
VKFDGVPLANAVVQFLPQQPPGVKLFGSSAMTDDKGRYRLMCENEKPGAVVATHRVVVLQGRDDPDNPRKAAKPKPVLPIAYSVASDTPLKVEVTADRHTYDLELKSRP